MSRWAGQTLIRFTHLALEGTPETSPAEYAGLFGARNRLAREWAQFFERYPLVIAPVNTAGPFEVGFDLGGADEIAQLLRAFRLVVALNLLGLPAAVVPSGVSGGLPQAVQLIAGRYREDICLDAAEAVEAALGTITPIDPR